MRNADNSIDPEYEHEPLKIEYPESVSISKYAVFGTRVAQPNRKNISRIYHIKFRLDVPGAFNITSNDGIIYVSNPFMLKNLTSSR